jgi:hypothetical protein
LHHIPSLADVTMGTKAGIVGFPWLHHIPSLADVTIGTKACNLPNAVKLN